MKKLITYLPLCFLIAVMLFQCLIFFGDDVVNNENVINEEEQYFRKINEIIKDLEFHLAKAKDGKIILYDRHYEPISEIPFAEYDKSITFIGAHKDDNTLYFITGGSVDDEWGIMFVNDGSDSMMNGLKRVDRMGGNAYEYSIKSEY